MSHTLESLETDAFEIECEQFHESKNPANPLWVSIKQNHVSLSNELLKLTCSDPETQFGNCVVPTREYGWSTPALHHHPDERRLATDVVAHHEKLRRVECG